MPTKPGCGSHTCTPLMTVHAYRLQGFPCTAKGAPSLSLEGCYFSLPTAPVGVLHFVRDPWDVVTSAYWYHQQQPAPEAWIDVPVRLGAACCAQAAA